MAKPDPADRKYLVPGLAITGLLLTGLAGLVHGVISGNGQALLAAAVAFSSIGWLVLR